MSLIWHLNPFTDMAWDRVLVMLSSKEGKKVLRLILVVVSKTPSFINANEASKKKHFAFLSFSLSFIPFGFLERGKVNIICLRWMVTRIYCCTIPGVKDHFVFVDWRKHNFSLNH